MGSEPNSSSPARANDGWLSRPERHALDWLAPRLPGWITADQLTALGLVGAIVALLGYVLAARQPAGLWVVNLGLIVNWLGDSLDGRVARFRNAERPRYGFFLDQSTDVLAQAIFSVGLAASGYVRPEIVAAGFAAYLMMTVQSLLRMQVTGIFHLSTGGIGLTEVRCLFFAGNIAFYLVPPHPFGLGGLTFSYPDFLGMAWIATNVGLYLATMLTELRRLNRQEPRRQD